MFYLLFCALIYPWLYSIPVKRGSVFPYKLQVQYLVNMNDFQCTQNKGSR